MGLDGYNNPELQLVSHTLQSDFDLLAFGLIPDCEESFADFSPAG